MAETCRIVCNGCEAEQLVPLCLNGVRDTVGNVVDASSTAGGKRVCRSGGWTHTFAAPELTALVADGSCKAVFEVTEDS